MAPPFGPPPEDAVVALRPWRAGDGPFLVAACNDPAVARFTKVPAPYTAEHARAWIAASAWLLELGREAHLAVADATDPERPPLGAAGVVAVDRAGGRAELGYWLAPEARGRGAATRAVTLLRDWAHGPLAIPRLVMRIHPQNLASRRVADRTGFRAVAHRNSDGLLAFVHQDCD
jgi:RimJ/RimL family protein N-acetyltransferase